MPTPESTADHYRQQQRLAAATVAAARRHWQRLGTEGFDATWRTVGARLTAAVAAAQLAAAADGARYVGAAVAELGLPTTAAGEVDPASLAGEASDGRPLDTLLYQPVIATKVAIGSGQPLPAALAFGQGLLDAIVRTQVADAAREASGIAIAARPGVSGWVRMLNLPSCSRCVVLAGKHFRWNQGFLRHPRCDCRHIPASEDLAQDLRTDPRAAIEAGQVRGLSGADTRAIVDGADVAQVINGRRGMYTADAGGQAVKATREAAGRTVRLRPEEIYRQAGADRGEAIRLLSRNGYLIT